MGYKGLDLGTGIQNYSNLMAQGYRDRADLQRQDLALSRQLQQQEFQNSVAAQQAAANGFGYQRPEVLQRYGVSNLPVDMNSLEVKQFAEQNPNSIQNGLANPYDARRLEVEEQKRLAREAAIQRTQMVEQGKNSRVQASRAGNPAGNVGQRQVAMLQLRALQKQMDDLNNPQKAILAEYQLKRQGSNVPQRMSELQAQFQALSGQLSAPQAQAPQQAAPQPAPQQKSVVKKLYSASRNQTKVVYSDGSEEVVSGKQ